MKKLFVFLYLGTFFVISAPKIGALGEPQEEMWVLSNGVRIHSQEILRFKDASTVEILETLEAEGIQFVSLNFRNKIPNIPEKYILQNEEEVKSWKRRIGLYYDESVIRRLYGFYVPLGDRWGWNPYDTPLFVLDTHIRKSEILHEYLHYLCDKFHTGGLGYVLTEEGEKISYKHKMKREAQAEHRYNNDFTKKLKTLVYEEEIAVAQILLEKFEHLNITEEEINLSQREHLSDFQKRLGELK